MSGSYERLNYVLRPAKHVERGMIVEALQRLSVFGPLRRYRYIGFGSTYFADFILVHRALGIKQMISIEQDEQNRDRFLFNRPFRTVEMLFGTSTEWLPKLSWKSPSIVWLDYDGTLTNDVLTDIDWVCSAALAGSVLIVTVNANPGEQKGRLDKLRAHIGAENIPNGITKDSQLAKWGLADVSRTVIDSSIREAIRDRSARTGRMSYEQLFNFHYSDGARMLTAGGMVLNDDQKGDFARCSFGDLSYVMSGTSAYELTVPFLTNREVRWLDRSLPATAAKMSGAKIPVEDREAYAKIYRFFPNFVNAEF